MTEQQLTCDAEHKYWLDKREQLPGVNEIMVGVGIIDPSWYTEEARYRGLYVHQATHYLDEGDYDISDCKPQYRGYVDAWIKAKLETGMEILDIEQMRWHPTYRFAGRRDRRVIWNRRRYIVDIKTIGTPGAPGPKWAAETTAAYSLLEPTSKGEPEDGRASILLYPDGHWKPEIHHDFSDKTHFLNYLATFRRLKFHGRIK